MQLLYVEEHKSCFNYDKKEVSDARLYSHAAHTELLADNTETEIVFVLDGALSLSYGKKRNQQIKARQMFLLPAGTRFTAEFQENTKLLRFRIRTSLQFCEGYAMEQLFAENPDTVDQFYPMNVNSRIESYLSNFVPMVQDGVMCCRYFQLKLDELMLLLRAYYPKPELARFFSPMLSAKAEFSDFVLKNYRNVKSVQELAELANYSQSGFEKHFKKVFGVSAAQWLRQKKSANLYHDLIHTNIPIKELCYQYGFSSHANMCDFCNRHFKSTPSQIREKGGMAVAG